MVFIHGQHLSEYSARNRFEQLQQRLHDGVGEWFERRDSHAAGEHDKFRTHRLRTERCLLGHRARVPQRDDLVRRTHGYQFPNG